MTPDPRYPVGPFVPPTARDAQRINAGIATLQALPTRLRAAVDGLDEASLDTSYRTGGWTIRQVVHHLADSHVNAYCRMRLALTEDEPTIRTYQEQLWAELLDGKTLPLEPSLQILTGLHHRWITFLGAVSEPEWDRTMIHPEHENPVTMWWMLAMYQWHATHHLAHITTWRASHSPQPRSS